MGNPYTGDFDVVAQVTEGTINRLSASQHQNNFRNLTVPSIPHEGQLRIDASPPGTARGDQLLGYARAQIAVPRVELIDRSTSTAWADLGVRAEYFPDPGTAHIPRFVNGSVRVMYEVDYQSSAGHASVKPLPSTIDVTMTAADPISPAGTLPKPDPQVPGRIQDVVTNLLVNAFPIPPIAMPADLRLDQVICLRPSGADAVVASPFAIHGQPIGDINSIQSAFTAGSDFAVAISVDALTSEINNALAVLQHWTLTTTFTQQIGGDVDLPVVGTVDVGFSVTIVYTTTFQTPVVTWHATGSSATIHIHVHGTSVTSSVLPNADFDIDVDLIVGFDPRSGALTLTPGTPIVSPDVHGPLGGLLNSTVQGDIQSALNANLPAMVAGAQQQLAAASQQIQGVSGLLQTIDAASGLHWSYADFNPDAVVLRGKITVSERDKPKVTFTRSPELVYDAYESWIPGGRIDEFDWAWIPYWGTWTANPNPASVLLDRYELIPGALPVLTKFGQATPAPSGIDKLIGGVHPPPFTDSEGAMYLRLRGVVTDVNTGELVPIETPWMWNVYGTPPPLPAGLAARLRRMIVAGPVRVQPGLPNEGNGVVVNSDPPATNTLYVHVGSTWSTGVQKSLAAGLDACSRRDAGLLVAVVFDKSAHARMEPKAARSLTRFLDKLPAPTVLLEDGDGQLANAIGKEPRRGARWCIAEPSGGLLWAASGELNGAAVAHALDTYLVRAPQVLPIALKPDSRTVASGITAVLREKDSNAATPDAPYGNATLTMFTAAGSAPSSHALAGLSEAINAGTITGRAVSVIIAGATQKDVAAIKRQLNREVTVVADEDGSITASCGVKYLPTVVTLSNRGRVLSSRVGASAPQSTGRREKR